MEGLVNRVCVRVSLNEVEQAIGSSGLLRMNCVERNELQEYSLRCSQVTGAIAAALRQNCDWTARTGWSFHKQVVDGVSHLVDEFKSRLSDAGRLCFESCERTTVGSEWHDLCLPKVKCVDAVNSRLDEYLEDPMCFLHSRREFMFERLTADEIDRVSDLS